jgi:mannosyltransferase OCH1-like enzyme
MISPQINASVMTPEGVQSDAETFFGICGGNNNSQPELPNRNFRRNVWSASVQEENQWMQYLLSLSNQHHGRVVDTNLAKYDGTSRIGCSNIPKIIHFIWLGGNFMPNFPFLRADIDDGDGLEQSEWNECIESWKVHHPPSKGWEIVVWTEKNIVNDDDEAIGGDDATTKFVLKHSQMLNKDAYRQALQMENYGAASDILRLDILNKFGGVYADIDYVCVGCLDGIVANVQAQFFCGASNTGCVELNNGLMACQKGGHAIVTEMIDSIHDHFENKLSKETRQEAAMSMLSSFLDATTLNALETSQADSFGTLSPMEVIERTGPGLLTRSVCRWLVENDGDDDSASQVIIFPSNAFHPFPNHLRNNLSTFDETTAQKLLMSFLTPKETKAVHLWGCSWQNEK